MRIIGGKYRGKSLLRPTHTRTRPTADRTRETLFNVLLHNPAFHSYSLEGKSVLDVFAGTGAFGLEAYSRGAGRVLFVENDPETLGVLEQNLKSFSLSSDSILRHDAIRLQGAREPYDLIFLDPPYDQGLVVPTLERLFAKGWLSPSSVVILEVGKKEEVQLPPFLTLVCRKTSGAAKLLFLKS